MDTPAKMPVASESEAGSQIDKVHLGGFVTRIKVVEALLIFQVKIQ